MSSRIISFLTLTFSVTLLLSFPVDAKSFEDALDDLRGNIKAKNPPPITLSEDQKQKEASFRDLVEKMKEDRKNVGPLFIK